MGSTQRSPDGTTYPADDWDIDSYARAEETMALMRVPQFLRSADPHDRLFVAGLDGTGNHLDRDKPSGKHSVVGKFYEQVDALHRGGSSHIAAGYVPGTFTQSNPLIRYPDGVFGNSFEERVETAYFQLCAQAKQWLDTDPQAQIRVVGVGFSRGAEEVAALTRLVHERGILNPATATIDWDKKEGIINHITYHGPPLIPPGQTLQAALLFDPVSTGVAEHDRRLAPSTVTALQVTAQDERRDQFKADLLIQPGLSEDRHHANVLVGGAHSDVGNTYRLDGLGVRSYNIGVDFLNRLSDVPLLQRRQVPDDPRSQVVHRSDLGAAIWTAHGFHDGMRDLRYDLGGRGCHPIKEDVCRSREPTDPALRERADETMPAMGPTGSREDRRLQELSERMARMIGAADRGDWAGFRQDQQVFAASANGQALMERSRQTVDRWDEQERAAEQQRLAQLQEQQAQEPLKRGRSR